MLDIELMLWDGGNDVQDFKVGCGEPCLTSVLIRKMFKLVIF